MGETNGATVVADPEAMVTMVEVHYADKPTKVYYAEAVGTYADQSRVTLFEPRYPRVGSKWVIDVADSTEMFVAKVPASQVPDLPQTD